MRLVPLLAVLLGAACSADETATPAGIEPGVGLTAQAGELRLGQPSDALGTAASRRARGVAGERFAYPDQHVSLLAGTDGVHQVCAEPGYAGRDADGIGLGSGRDAVRAAFGEPEVEPFLGAWLYTARGIVFEWEEDLVTRLCVFRPED